MKQFTSPRDRFSCEAHGEVRRQARFGELGVEECDKRRNLVLRDGDARRHRFLALERLPLGFRRR